MKHVCLAITTYAALVLQTGWSARLTAGDILPVFLPLMIVVAIFGLKGPAALVWAAVIGLLGDCLTAEPLGIEMLCALSVTFVAGRMLADRTVGSSSRLPSLRLFVLVTFLTVESMLIVSTAARVLLTGRTVSAASLLSATSASAAYSTLIALAVYLFAKLLARILPFGRSAPRTQSSATWN
ncbi:MAG: hypothetical protein IID45_11575 [Planctomycetes bacterium]|nr:hypothetical protein [Planctomycetota bacterium]